MQPRSLQAILSELDTVGGYGQQTANYRQRQADIPGQVAAEEQGLQAKQQNAFGDIERSANRKGMLFSGFSPDQQAKYTATEYMPALARLRQSGREQAMGLEDAILGIQQNRLGQAQSIRQNEVSLGEQRRQFDINAGMQRQQMAAASGFSPTLGKQDGGEKADPMHQLAYNDVWTRVNKLPADQIKSDYMATLASANYGNLRDKAKIQIYNQLGYNFQPAPANGGIRVGVAQPTQRIRI